MGGFYNSLFFLGLFIYSQFSGTLFFASIIQKIYIIDQPLSEQEGDAGNKVVEAKVKGAPKKGKGAPKVEDDEASGSSRKLSSQKERLEYKESLIKELAE